MVDRGVRGEVEVREALGAGEARFVDPTGRAAFLAVVALGEEQLGQERPVRQLLASGGVGDLGVAVAERGQAKQSGGAVDRSIDGLLTGLSTTARRAGLADGGGAGGHASLVPVSRLS